MKFSFLKYLLRHLGFSPVDPDEPLPIALPEAVKLTVLTDPPAISFRGRLKFFQHVSTPSKERWRRRHRRDARQRNYPAWKRQQ